jgi:signal transduction histidine kinase
MTESALTSLKQENGGLGLLSLEERVRQVQGTLRIESSPKKRNGAARSSTLGRA